MDVLTLAGAVDTVLSLAVDAFSQQLSNFYSCPWPVDGVAASIARTNNYSVSDYLDAAPYYPVDPEITIPLYEGLLSPSLNIFSLVSTSCPSGNCVFTGTYSSLAMCSSMREISDQIIAMETDDSNGWNFSLPSGTSLSGYEVLVSRANLTDLHGMTLTVEILTVEAAYRKESSPNYSPKPRAFHVNFSPCVHTYGNISYSNTVFDETILSTTMHSFIKDSYSPVSSSFSPNINCTPSDSPQGRKIQPTIPSENGLRYPNHRPNASSEPNTLYFDTSTGPASTSMGSPILMLFICFSI